jgi:hypothetical protein
VFYYAAISCIEALAEKYDLALSSVYAFRDRKKARIARILDDWSNEFSDLWGDKKHTRAADILYLADTIQERTDELVDDAERATETMRKIDLDADPVRVPLREWKSLVREKARLLHQLAEEMGQLPQHIDPLLEDWSPLTRLRFVGLHPNSDVKDQAKNVYGPQPRDRHDKAPASPRSSLPDPLQVIRDRIALLADPGPVQRMLELMLSRGRYPEPVPDAPVENVPASEAAPVMASPPRRTSGNLAMPGGGKVGFALGMATTHIGG